MRIWKMSPALAQTSLRVPLQRCPDTKLVEYAGPQFGNHPAHGGGRRIEQGTGIIKPGLQRAAIALVMYPGNGKVGLDPS